MKRLDEVMLEQVEADIQAALEGLSPQEAIQVLLGVKALYDDWTCPKCGVSGLYMPEERKCCRCGTGRWS